MRAKIQKKRPVVRVSLTPVRINSVVKEKLLKKTRNSLRISLIRDRQRRLTRLTRPTQLNFQICFLTKRSNSLTCRGGKNPPSPSRLRTRLICYLLARLRISQPQRQWLFFHSRSIKTLSCPLSLIHSPGCRWVAIMAPSTRSGRTHGSTKAPSETGALIRVKVKTSTQTTLMRMVRLLQK